MSHKELYLARKTVIEMLTDRGFNTSNIIKNYSENEFKRICRHFDNYSGVLDMDVRNNDGLRTVVKFIKDREMSKTVRTTKNIHESAEVSRAKKEIKQLSEYLKQTLLLDKRDIIVFVVCYGDRIHDFHLEYESNYSNIQIFHLSQLVFNITHHNLVPKHEILSSEERAIIIKKLHLTSVNKLPFILGTDPVAKYFNMADGDICRIYRPSKSTGTHICYRVCIFEKLILDGLVNSKRGKRRRTGEKISQLLKEDVKMGDVNNATITLTFGDRVENHEGNQVIGNLAQEGSGFSIFDLETARDLAVSSNLETELVNQGIRPAVNVGLSVSRVGSAAQTKAMKKVAGSIKLELAQYREMAAFAQFGSDLDASTQQLLNRGAKLTELLKQDQYSPMTVAEQVVSVFTGVKGYLDDIDLSSIKMFEKEIIEKIKSEKPEIITDIQSTGKLEENNEKLLAQIIEEYKKGKK